MTFSVYMYTICGTLRGLIKELMPSWHNILTVDRILTCFVLSYTNYIISSRYFLFLLKNCNMTVVIIIITIKIFKMIQTYNLERWEKKASCSRYFLEHVYYIYLFFNRLPVWINRQNTIIKIIKNIKTYIFIYFFLLEGH
jgi:hypothetical protein